MNVKNLFSILAVLLCASCASQQGALSQFRPFGGAVLEEGPLGFILNGPEEGSHVLRRIDTYTKHMTLEFSLQAAEDSERRNGFLVLWDGQRPENVIYAGVYIGSQEYVIEGPGVAEAIRVPVAFEPDRLFHIRIIVDLEKRFIEMSVDGREIGTGLNPTLGEICVIGYKAQVARTHFSPITVTGE